MNSMSPLFYEYCAMKRFHSMGIVFRAEDIEAYKGNAFLFFDQETDRLNEEDRKRAEKARKR